MDQRLVMAAQCGDMDTLYTLIQEDPYLLERIDQVPFVDTPLHIAASAGHTHFAMEIMRLKPSYARKPNQKGFSPIHLALQNGQTQLVLRLIEVDRDLVRVQGREGITPLHFVAAEGNNVDLLAEFLAACPKSIQDLTIRKETALHTAVKNYNLVGLKVLLGWLEHVDKDVGLKWTDDEGNTVLHIAASMNQIEMARLLISRVDINAKNLQGLTALDILQERRRSGDKLKVMLLRAGALKGSSLPSVPTLSDSLKKKMSWFERKIISHYRKRLYMSNEDRNVILVVAVLIVTATNYQAILGAHDDNSSAGNTILTKTNTTFTPPPQPQPQPQPQPYKDTNLQFILTSFNTIAFFVSTIEIYLHLPGGNRILKMIIPALILNMLTMTATQPTSMFASGKTFIFLFPFLFLTYLSKIPVVLHKLNPMTVYTRSMEVKQSVLTHCSSFNRELST